MPYNFEGRYNEIREELIKQGYANKHITYSEFLAIYEPYKEEMSEKEFIQVLGISYSNFQNIKNRNKRAIILKKKIEKRELEELKKFIISDLTQKGYGDKKIDYNEFLSLYEPYRGEVKESEFASILGISYGNWQSIKNKGQRAIILKKKIEKQELEELKKFIISDLTQKGYGDKKIDYNEFLSLYEPYKEKLKESEFASILGITYGNWKNVKNKGRRATILKKSIEKKELEELKQFIVSDLTQKGYGDKKIDYNEFLSLYEPYKEKLKESEFANILGMSYASWQAIKNRGQRAKILKQEKSACKKAELKELEHFIVSDLTQKGYGDKKIDYNEFWSLYEPYRSKLKESEFANILGISYSSWQHLKNKKQKVIILKKEIPDDEKKNLEELEKWILLDLIQKGYKNKNIDYNEFLRLYAPYKEKFKEDEFANILGISYSNLRHIKNDGQRAIILKKRKISIRKYRIERIRTFYSIRFNQKGYKNKSIDYTDFLRLYEPYKEKLKESEFADILGMSYGSLKSIKNNGQKAIILKRKPGKKELEKLKKLIVSDLIQKGYRNKRIDYNEFWGLYEPYKEKLKESEFANILGMSYVKLAKYEI